jgi:tyrosine aminotransferase
LVNNPSNPCGSVYSKEHLIQIIAFAEKHRIPIIADEIYWDMAFSGSKFYPLASLTQTVPIISLGALSKRWLVPGWRMGWLLIFDPAKKLHEVRKGMIMLAQRLCGPNAIVQGALSDIFSNVPEAFYSSLNSQLESLAHLCINSLKGIHGLHPLPPQGTMYIMVEIKISEFSDIKDDMDFCQKLLAEENVLLLPGRAFGLNNFFRIVFCGPEDILKQSAQRISEFCVRHAR